MQTIAGTGPHVNTAWDDSHLVPMAMMDCSISFTVLSRHWSTAMGLDLSASTVCHSLLKTGLVPRMPVCRLPLSKDYQCLKLQCARERRHWHAEW